MIDFTLAIVNWNTKALLKNCLQSIRACQDENLKVQVLVLDNASDDGSADMVETHFPEVYLVRNPDNVGFAKGHELLRPYAKGRFHVLVNSDIELRPGCLKTIYKRMTEDRMIGVLVPQIVGPGESIQPSCRRLPTLLLLLWDAIGFGKLIGGWLNPYHMASFDHRSSRSVQQVMGSFFVIRASLLPQIGFLDTRFFMYFEEVDFCKRVLEKGCKVYFDSEAQVYHEGGGSSRHVRTQTIRRTMRSMHQYFRKHRGRWVTLPLAVITGIDTFTHTVFSAFKFRNPIPVLKAYSLGVWDIVSQKRADNA